MEGTRVLASQEVELERLGKVIPPEHRGVKFQRILKEFHPQENTRRLELAFAETWAAKNDPDEYNPLLASLLLRDAEEDPRHNFIPQNEREWQVAYLVAATVIQWLPTSVGCAFLREAFEKGGGKFKYELPKV